MREQLLKVKRHGAAALLAGLALLGQGSLSARAAAASPSSAPAVLADPSASPAHCPPLLPMPPPATQLQLARQARDRGMLWKLDFQGRTSWLYGVIHVNKLDWFFPGPTIAQALHTSDRLALELNVLDPAVMQALVAGLRAQPGAPALPAALQQRLDTQLRAACAPTGLSQLRPEAQLMTLLSLIGRREGLDLQFGVDLMLARRAQALGKPVIGLESVATQLRELVSDEPAQVQDSVRTGLDQLEQGDVPQQLAQLAQVWADGDVQRLEQYAQWCNCLNSAAERADYARLVEGRNPGMAQAIAAQLRAGHTLLVAVGALHLIGLHGLPALLAAQGFAVQPVPWTASMPKTAPAQ